MFLAPNERTLSIPTRAGGGLDDDSELSDDMNSMSLSEIRPSRPPPRTPHRIDRGAPSGNGSRINRMSSLDDSVASNEEGEGKASLEPKRTRPPTVRFKIESSGPGPVSSIGDGGALGEIIKEFLCPLTNELPVDPVAAEDGRNYEREAIQQWIERKPRGEVVSPATGRPMGPKILPATQVRNAIERAVRSGAISGPQVERWAKRVRTEAEVEKMHRRAADERDTEAMYLLGVWNQCGKRGMKRNVSKAYEWYEKSADGGNVRGMAAMGFLLVKGEGTPCNKVEGIALITFAACEQGGVDAAAFCLANWYHQGLYGLPKSDKWAMFWLSRVVSGGCSIRDMDDRGLEKARALLNEIRMKPKPTGPYSLSDAVGR